MAAEYPIVKQPGANIPPIRRYPDKFEGTNVLVTGAAQGIGEVTATMFATQGAFVILVDINESKLKTVSTNLNDQGHKTTFHICNLTNESEVQTMISTLITQHTKIDVLVHLAGIYPFAPITSHTTSDYDRVMSINMTSTFYLTRSILPHMNAAGYGRIINTTSGAILQPVPGLGVYAASKAAVAAFTRSTAVEAGPGVTANMVCPSIIYNSSTWANPGSREYFNVSLGQQCVKRYGLPEDVASVICFIASPESEFVTGQLFDIGGGITFG